METESGESSSTVMVSPLELSQNFLMTLPHSVLSSSPVTKGESLTLAESPRGQVVPWQRDSQPRLQGQIPETVEAQNTRTKGN